MLFIHIGTHKTGTSSIQTALARASAGTTVPPLIYPDIGRLGDGHHAWPWALRQVNEQSDFAAIASAFLEQYDPDRRYIISSEEFSFLTPKFIREIKYCFKDIDVRIICYLRRRSDFLISEYKQHVLMMNTRFTGSVFSFYARKGMHSRLRYFSLLENWASIFGRDKIIPAVYDRDLFPNKDIMTDLLELLGVEGTLTEPAQDVNRSLSDGATAILRGLNNLELTPPERGRLIDKLRSLGPVPAEAPLLGEADRTTINQSFRHDDGDLIKGFQFRPKDRRYIQLHWTVVAR